MGWKILCSVSDLKLGSLAADLQANTEHAKTSYSHAFLAYSPKKNFLPSDPKTSFTEFSSQKCTVFVRDDGLPKGAVDGYYMCGDKLAVVVDQGDQALEDSMIIEWGKTFMKDVAASTATKKGYPLDCLGYCVLVVKKLTGLDKVAGH